MLSQHRRSHRRAGGRARRGWPTLIPLAACLGVLAGAPCLGGAAIELINIASDGSQSIGEHEHPVVSADGQIVAFESRSSSLVSGDENNVDDVFVRDRAAGTIERISVAFDGALDGGGGSRPRLSASGRFVVFGSSSATIVPNDTNGKSDIFVYDRDTDTVERVSVGLGGAEANDHSSTGETPCISADGRYVVFASRATNLVANDTNGRDDVFVHDRQTHTTTRVSVSSGGGEASSNCDEPTISADGNLVFFESYAADLVADDTNGATDIFVRDRAAGTTTRIALTHDGAESDGACTLEATTSDGRFVVFLSSANNIVPDDTPYTTDVFIRDRQAATTERVSLTWDGREPDQPASNASCSDDGRFVVLDCESDLVPGEANGRRDVFIYDRQRGVMECASLTTDGAATTGASYLPKISANGQAIVFMSTAAELVPPDANANVDIFLVTLAPDPPSAADDTATVDEDTAGNLIDALDNDTDPQQSPLELLAVWQPPHGTARIVGGQIEYTPDPDFPNPKDSAEDIYEQACQAGSGSRSGMSQTSIRHRL